MLNTISKFGDMIHRNARKPIHAATCGAAVSSRNSPVLSRQELQRVILEMVG